MINSPTPVKGKTTACKKLRRDHCNLPDRIISLIALPEETQAIIYFNLNQKDRSSLPILNRYFRDMTLKANKNIAKFSDSFEDMEVTYDQLSNIANNILNESKAYTAAFHQIVKRKLTLQQKLDGYLKEKMKHLTAILSAGGCRTAQMGEALIINSTLNFHRNELAIFEAQDLLKSTIEYIGIMIYMLHYKQAIVCLYLCSEHLLDKLCLFKSLLDIDHNNENTCELNQLRSYAPSDIQNAIITIEQLLSSLVPFVNLDTTNELPKDAMFHPTSFKIYAAQKGNSNVNDHVAFELYDVVKTKVHREVGKLSSKHISEQPVDLLFRYLPNHKTISAWLNTLNKDLQAGSTQSKAANNEKCVMR